MYTTMNVKMVLKEEHTDKIARIIERKSEWVDEYPDCIFSNMGRSSFIPGGSICYSNFYEGDLYENKMCGNIWQFSCSLKNYDGEIEVFFTEMIPIISKEALSFLVWYEESLAPKDYLREVKENN